MVKMSSFKLELLSPAKNLKCGIAAINHGADAVYIGGPEFGARAAAGNSLEDIEELVAHAHRFFARVYVAVNTVLTDRELESAVNLAHAFHDMGVDALIIQDMGFLESEMPPIPLHASTQVDNRTPEKVRFLEDVGFQQVVLARELSLKQIAKIRNKTTVPLEFFVHGALCVSYSGQCYISEVMAGRSANRGECAQFCRHKYSLKDARGRVIARDRYLLSLKDMDLAKQLRNLIDAGISSFKIEGRLKDENYVKNVTAFYRQALDTIMENDSSLSPSSSGTCRFSFTPDTTKSFNRGKTEYFLNKKRNLVGAIKSPKSIGQRLGTVKLAERNYFVLNSQETISNGDGLCFFHPDSGLTGIKVNRVEGQRIYPRYPPKFPQGAVVYRNADILFNKLLSQSANCRTIEISISIKETVAGLSLTIVDEEGISSETEREVEKEVARQQGMIVAVAEKQVRKCGNSSFTVKDVRVAINPAAYLAPSVFNELRRRAFAHHLAVRLDNYQPQTFKIHVNNIPWIAGKVTYLDNITNKKAETFYLRHGIEQNNLPRPRQATMDDTLMTCKYCIRAQLALCPKMVKNVVQPAESLTLVDSTGEYCLDFDCDKCEMVVTKND